MTDEEMAKEYEEKAEYVEVDDYGKKRYDSIDIQQAFLAGLKVGRQEEQLTKAKEIIKDCIHILKHSGTALDWKTVINQAEQFLKEIEK